MHHRLVDALPVGAHALAVEAREDRSRRHAVKTIPVITDLNIHTLATFTRTAQLKPSAHLTQVGSPASMREVKVGGGRAETRGAARRPPTFTSRARAQG